MTRSITAYFDNVGDAEKAAFNLAQRVPGVRGNVYDARTDATALDALALPAEDATALHEGFRRGGGVVHAEVPDGRFEEVAEVLEHSGAVDLDEREAAWRKEGWQGHAAAQPAPVTTPQAEATGSAVGGNVQRLGPAQDEARIPVMEERIRIGKREAGHGRVRIRSYVVETPVQEQVSLREERVSVERRPVDRALAAGEQAGFGERVIEATETSEEAVVAKEARVKEEVVVKKTAEERTQTVSDTVRRTEVEVEDDRRAGTAAPTAKPAGPAPRR